MTGPRRDPAGERNVAYVGVVRQLRANGFSPIPLADKAPAIKGWPAIFCERLPSMEEIEQEWSSRRRGTHVMNGVGVATAHGLVIIDVDEDDAVERVLMVVPQARAAPACVGHRGRKIFLRAADGTNARERNITGASTAGALEVLSWHRQGVIPPTVHPKTGQPYTWVDERCTLLTMPLEDLPTLSDADIDALRSAFVTPNRPTAARSKSEPRQRRTEGAKSVAPAPADAPPDRWWEESPNRSKIERLVGLFGIVHRAARDLGGRIILHADGVDAAGSPHRPETIDINATDHWKHAVRIIVDVLGNTQEAYWAHIEVSRGNASLDLPGGPHTYDEVGNRRFFDTVVSSRDFEAKSGKRARTMGSLAWWARMVEGRPSPPRHERRKGLVAAFHGSVARLQAAGVEPNIATARRRAVLIFRGESKRLAIVDEALGFIARGGGSAWMTDIAEVAAAHDVSVRTVQLALSTAERAGILVRTRGNEGGKQILMSVPPMVGPETDRNVRNSEDSPSLHRGVCGCGGRMEGPEHGNAGSGSLPDEIAYDDGWPDWSEAEDEALPAPFGIVQRAGTPEEQQAFDELLEEARTGRCTEGTLLLSGILPTEASSILLQIVQQNRAGKKTGSKWLRHIASEIGELVLREPDRWPWQLQGALDYVAYRLERTKGRPTPVKWVRIFAENIGFIHERAGRLTPMARSAQYARRRRERAQSAESDAARRERAGKKADGNP